MHDESRARDNSQDLNKSDVAVITMVRSDLFFLRKWIAYYGALFGKQNLYILLHGGHPEMVEACDGCNVIRLPIRSRDDTVGRFIFNRHRADAVEGLSRGLLKYYSYLIYTDVDEFIVVDPDVGLDLPAFIRANIGTGVLSPLGLDVVHRSDEEPVPLAADRPILGIRKFCRIADRYTKPIIISSPISWEGGFHHADCHRLKIPEGLYLFHLKWVDEKLTTDNHYARSLNFAGRDISNFQSYKEPTPEFRLKPVLNKEFVKFNSQEVVNEFDFSAARAFYRRTWRPHGFLLRSRFWKWLFRQDKERYVFYWRYKSLGDKRIFRIPDRFFEIF